MIKSCLDTSFDKNFKYGSSAQQSGSKNCQLFLAEQCASNSSFGCINYVQPDPLLPGFDIFERPIQQSAQDAYVRNIALARFVYYVPYCSVSKQQLNPQNIISPSVVFWKNNRSIGHCQPILTMTDDQITSYLSNQDDIIPKLIAARPKFDDVLKSIRASLIATNKWETLYGTDFFTHYST